MSENLFAQYAAEREEEQHDIEDVGVKGLAEKTAITPGDETSGDGLTAEKAKAAGRPKKSGRKTALGITVSEKVKSGLKIMAIRKGITVSEMIEEWYFEHK